MSKILSHILFVSLVAPVSGSALAQSEDDEADKPFDEVIVTSTRREKNVMEVSQSIQAIPESVLELPTMRNMSDVYNLVPGATVSSNKAPNKEGMQLRGSGISQTGSSDGSSPVGYYVDDIPYFDISTPVPPPIGTFDIQQVEILRGPQGTSYGQDSAGGNVILRTNPVDLQNFGYKVRLGVSDVSGVSGTGSTIGGVVNIPIAEDVFGVRIAYLREEDPGYGSVIGRPDIKNPLENTRDTLRIKALWNVTEDFDIELTHSQWDTEYSTLPGLQIADSSGGEMLLAELTGEMALSLFPDGRPTSDYEVSWTTLRASYDLGAAELTYSAGHVDTPKKETNSEILFFGFLTTVIFNQPAESTSHELRLVSQTDSPLQWLAGLFITDAESNSGGWTDTPDFLFRDFTSSVAEFESQSIYGEIEYAFNDQWSAQAGLRYHDEERTSRTSGSASSFFPCCSYFTDPLFGPYADVTPESVEDSDFSNLSYRVGLTWSPSDNGLVYLTNSLVTRAPIILSVADKAALENAGVSQIGDTDAAELLNTEIGTKWTLADGRVQLEAAYVFSVWDDVPLWSEVAVPPSTVNMAIGGTDAEVSIVELSLSWAATDDLTLTYAGSWTDTEVTTVPDPVDVPFYPPAVQLGGELPNYSPTTHNFGVNYNHTLSNDWDIFASANYVTRDEPNGLDVFINPFEYNPAADPYENLGLTIGAAKGNWDIAFSVLNATDDSGQYLPRTANGGDDARLFGLIQPPRTYAFQVSYNGMP